MKLDEKDREIIKLLSEGLTTKEIGLKVFLSKKTVEFRIAKMREQIGAINTTNLIFLYHSIFSISSESSNN